VESTERLEIADICLGLEKLAGSGIFSQQTQEACAQAAFLLLEMRALVLSRDREADIVEKLRWLLAQQGEG
jgi:hypothetical protein